MGRRRLGQLEQQVLEFLWAHGSATGEDVRTAVGKNRPLTDSTIRTVLRRLEAKQFVRHDVDGTKFLYSAVHERRKVATDAVVQVIKKLCHGSLEEMLTGLVDSHVVNATELKRLVAKIDAHESAATRTAATKGRRS
jgi:BlaI family penicillinase repressor